MNEQDIEQFHEDARDLARELLEILKQRYGHLSEPPEVACVAAGILYAAMFNKSPDRAHRLLDVIYNLHGYKPGEN